MTKQESSRNRHLHLLATPPTLLAIAAVAVVVTTHFAPPPASAQVVEMDEFRVPASTTYTITADQTSMRVQRWIMEPGSTVQLRRGR